MKDSLSRIAETAFAILQLCFLVQMRGAEASGRSTSHLVDALITYGFQDPAATREMLSSREAGAEACRGTVTMTGVVGHILSPVAQIDPAGVMDCRWVVVAPPGKIIRFQLHRLSLSCDDNDIFEVTSFSHRDVTRGTSLLTQCESYSVDFLTDLEADAMYTDVNKAVVHFRARMSSYKNIHMKYEVLDAHPGCYNGETKRLTASDGSLTSPFIDTGYYPYNTRCSWLLVAPRGHIIKLHFTSFDITYDTACAYDVVLLRDGDNSRKLAATLCGSSIPLKFVSTRNRLLVQFKAAAENHVGGFNFTWTFVKTGYRDEMKGCEGTPAVLRGEDEGTIESPQLAGTVSYPNNARCAWIIEVNETKLVQLFFELFSLQGDSPECLHDHVKIYDGTIPTQSALRETFCSRSILPVVLSRGNAMLVTFSSDASVTGTGFRITYRARTITPCGMPAIEPNIAISDSFVRATTTTVRPPQVHGVGPGAIMHVYGGHETAPHSWPWQVVVTFNGRFSCGGSIVHSRWVVTAAHCFDRALIDYSTVVVGLHDQSPENFANDRTYLIRRVVLAPDYESPAYRDIALVELEEDIVFNAAVSPVCLPSHDVIDDAECVTTGWGKTEDEWSSRKLQQAKQRIVSQDTCARDDWWGGDYVDNFTICANYGAGERYIGTCRGDSGGPLVCKQNGRWSLYGVTSFGSSDCSNVKKPAVFTRVHRFVDWIQTATHGDVLPLSKSG